MNERNRHVVSDAVGAMPIRVALFGGEPLLRDGLRAIIERQPDMQTMSADDLDRLMHSGVDGPTAIVLDIDTDGAQAAVLLRQTKQNWPAAHVVVVTSSCDSERAHEFVLLGASGVFTKDKPGSELAIAIRRVVAGEVWIGRDSMSQLVVTLASHSTARPVDSTGRRIELLTARELEVVKSVGSGCNNKAIAARLGISDNTVRHHLTSIFAKLQVPDRLALALFAMRHGLVASAKVQTGA
ncbi:MAG TPA: response regulator transcription factor [Casimicrobiaceae bacterium]|nr:response regulator transcription factor [Casimicrobiaceae bacterium]